jgi:hypothetical protein
MKRRGNGVKGSCFIGSGDEDGEPARVVVHDAFRRHVYGAPPFNLPFNPPRARQRGRMHVALAASKAR